MNELKECFLKKFSEKKKAREIQEKKAQQFLEDTYNGCKAFVNEFRFLEDKEFGFELRIRKVYNDGCVPVWEKYTYEVCMTCRGHHFANVYADASVIKEKNIVCWSWQLNKGGFKIYGSYKEVLDDIADKIN